MPSPIAPRAVSWHTYVPKLVTVLQADGHTLQFAEGFAEAIQLAAIPLKGV
jgi:hypothetical protein